MRKINKRIDTYDIAKGFGILLVYFGHVPPTADVTTFIYSFHMPLFFFLSGLFFSEKKYTFFDFVKRKSKTLIIPLFTFVLFSLIMSYVQTFDFSNLSFGINGPLWFLPVLFLSELLLFLVWSFFCSLRNRWLFIILIGLLAIVIDYSHVKFPFALHVIPLASFFLGLGNILMKWISEFIKMRMFMHTLFSCITIVILFLFSYYGTDRTNLHVGHMMYYELGILISLIGIVSVISLSSIVDKVGYTAPKKSLTYLGRNSLVIFGCHLPIIDAVGMKGSLFFCKPLLYIGGNVCILLILCGFAWLINRKCSWLLGKF